MPINDLFDRYHSIPTPEYDLGCARMKPLDIATQVYSDFSHLDFNHVIFRARIRDTRLGSETLSIEQEVVDWVRELLGFDRNFMGEMVSGSTEGIITSLWHAREYFKRRFSIRPIVLMSELTHHAFLKGCDILEIEYRKIPVSRSYQLCIDGLRQEIEQLETDRPGAPLIVVLTLGYTATGTHDSLDSLQEFVLSRGNKENKDVLLILDGAIGGLTIPFLIPNWGKPSSDCVFAFVTDFHKYGFCHYGTGLLLYNERFNEEKGVAVPYAPNRTESSLSASRSALPALAARAVIASLGRDGWKSILDQCMQRREELSSLLRKFPTVTVISEPSGVPCLTIDFGLLPEQAHILEKTFHIVPFPFKPQGTANNYRWCHRIYLHNGVNRDCLMLFSQLLQEAFSV